MAQDPFPGPGHDGGQPPRPGEAARDGAAAPDGAAQDPPWYPVLPPDDPDYDPDAIVQEIIDAVDSGREQVPDAGEGSMRGAVISLGEACDVDLPALAKMTGPDGLAGLGFHQDKMADAMRPGPVLDALTAGAADSPGELTDNQLSGMISAAIRLQAYAQWLELAGTAEFARRREAAYEASKARGDKPRHRDGEYAAEELAMEQLISRHAAAARMDMAGNLAGRLPCTFAGLRAGTISGDRARIIHRQTFPLSDAAAAEADKILAAAAPGLSPGGLYAKARRVCYRLDPVAFDREREEAARTRRRVEVRSEDSGNAQVSARELPAEEAAAVKAGIWAEAARLRNAGLKLPLREIRALVLTDRALGRDPWDRLAPEPEPPAGPDGPDGYDDPVTGTGPLPDDGGPVWDEGYREDEDDEGCRQDEDDEALPDRDGQDEGHPGGRAGQPFGRGPAPLPALINLIVPAGAAFGWTNELGEAAGTGLLDPAQLQAFLQAASRHPRTRTCVTLTDPETGEAIAHGCARGTHPWIPPRPGQDPRQALHDYLRRLNVTLELIAKGTCDHRHREDRYEPSRKLKHLTRARTSTCCAPGCGAQALTGEIDHTTPWPRGPTDQCNLGPPCIRHHKVKHAPGWTLQQPQPGIMKWTVPSGRVYTTRPTCYNE